MEKFPETYNLSKLDEEAESLNRLITAGEIETVIKKNPQHTKALEQTVSQENFIKHLRNS